MVKSFITEPGLLGSEGFHDNNTFSLSRSTTYALKDEGGNPLWLRTARTFFGNISGELLANNRLVDTIALLKIITTEKNNRLLTN